MHLVRSIVVAGLAACGAPPSPAEPPPPPGRPVAAGYEYLTFVTAGAAADARLPMLVGLHYSSARPETIAGDFAQLAIPVRVVLPRGKHPRRDGYSWFPGDYAQRTADAQVAATFAVKDELVAFLDAVTAAHPTAGKPVMTGVSYGGDLSYLIAIHHPDELAAAFPVGARFPAAWLPTARTCDAGCPPVHVMHGDADAIIPVDGARAAAARLAALGYPVELHEYAGAGHDFTAPMKADFAAALARVLARP